MGGPFPSLCTHTAVQRADANVVGVLLRAGADPNGKLTERYHNERGFNQDSSSTPEVPAKLMSRVVEAHVSLIVGKDAEDPKNLCFICASCERHCFFVYVLFTNRR